MKLLDTHVLLWLLYEPQRLTAKVRDALESDDEIFMSMASYWEVAIKHAQGRLGYSPASLMFGVGSAGLEELHIEHRHIIKVQELHLPGDPFDGMLVAQAEADGLTLITADRALLASPYATLDARS